MFSKSCAILLTATLAFVAADVRSLLKSLNAQPGGGSISLQQEQTLPQQLLQQQGTSLPQQRQQNLPLRQAQQPNLLQQQQIVPQQLLQQQGASLPQQRQQNLPLRQTQQPNLLQQQQIVPQEQLLQQQGGSLLQPQQQNLPLRQAQQPNLLSEESLLQQTLLDQPSQQQPLGVLRQENLVLSQPAERQRPNLRLQQDFSTQPGQNQQTLSRVQQGFGPQDTLQRAAAAPSPEVADDGFLTQGIAQGAAQAQSRLQSGGVVGQPGPQGAPVQRVQQSAPQRAPGVVLISGGSSPLSAPADVTITTEVTVDRFTTLTNLAYNSVPVTLTEFMKVTLTAPTFQAVTTPVDDVVLVSRVPVSRTDTITVTDTNTGHQYATEVSTVLHTITHKLYDIRQQTVTSLVVQTQLVRPRIVSTLIHTEYETLTETRAVTHTVVEEPFVTRSGPAPLRRRYFA